MCVRKGRAQVVECSVEEAVITAPPVRRGIDRRGADEMHVWLPCCCQGASEKQG